VVEQHSKKRRHGGLAQSSERSHRRRHFHPDDDGLLQTADELAGGTKQGPPDRLGLNSPSLCSMTSATSNRRVGTRAVASAVLSGFPPDAPTPAALRTAHTTAKSRHIFFCLNAVIGSASPALSSSRPGLSALSLPCRPRTFASPISPRASHKNRLVPLALQP